MGEKDKLRTLPDEPVRVLLAAGQKLSYSGRAYFESPLDRSHAQPQSRLHQYVRIRAAIHTSLVLHSPSQPHYQPLQCLIDTVAARTTSTLLPPLSAAYSLLSRTRPNNHVDAFDEIAHRLRPKRKHIGNDYLSSITLVSIQAQFCCRQPPTEHSDDIKDTSKDSTRATKV